MQPKRRHGGGGGLYAPGVINVPCPLWSQSLGTAHAKPAIFIGWRSATLPDVGDAVLHIQ